jgi:hypothetical protein
MPLEKPDESTAKSLSIACNAKPSSINSLRYGVRRFALKIIRDGIEVRDFRDIALRVGILKIADEPRL